MKKQELKKTKISILRVYKIHFSHINNVCMKFIYYLKRFLLFHMTSLPIQDAKVLVGPMKERLDIKVAMSNSFGFGGHNSSILFTPFKGN